jgi:hypothetical protein
METAFTVETMKTFAVFRDYCKSFYSVERENAIYPFATDTEIHDACIAHMTNPNPAFEFDGDSLDRETVRDLILAKRKLIGIGETDFDKAIVK